MSLCYVPRGQSFISLVSLYCTFHCMLYVRLSCQLKYLLTYLVYVWVRHLFRPFEVSTKCKIWFCCSRLDLFFHSRNCVQINDHLYGLLFLNWYTETLCYSHKCQAASWLKLIMLATSIFTMITRNVGQCPTWWPPCRIQVVPSVQRRKVWLTPTSREPCSNAANTRNPLKFAWVPQTRQQISAGSRPKFTILWRHVEKILLFNKFFFLPIVNTCLSCEDMVRQSWAMVLRWRFFASCIYSEPSAARFRPAF